MKKTILLIICMAVAMGAQAKVTEAEHKKNIETIAAFKQQGWIHRIDMEAHKISVDAAFWKNLTYEQKVGFMVILVQYFEYETDLKYITVVDKMNHKKIGSYGVFKGFKVYD